MSKRCLIAADCDLIACKKVSDSNLVDCKKFFSAQIIESSDNDYLKTQTLMKLLQKFNPCILKVYT